MTLVEVVIALAITVLTIAGIVNGYIYCMAATTKEGLYMAANDRALERLEQARAAVWDTASYPAVDQLVPANFSNVVVNLDKNGTGSEVTTATVITTIAPISDTPPLRRIRVDCVWLFRGTEAVTNSIETCRAPDQ
ncbi:MAG: hypothetical protein P4N60_15385 [Verrucomicrobiae bacterium]|nr:hypothetical protein [Verrucomicrobiae bacterium]